MLALRTSVDMLQLPLDMTLRRALFRSPPPGSSFRFAHNVAASTGAQAACRQNTNEPTASASHVSGKGRFAYQRARKTVIMAATK